MRKIGVLLSCLALLLGLCSCGGNDGDAVTVQSVSSITGGGYIGAYNRFAGIVSARSETVIKKDDSRIINEIKVEAGDHVEKGQVLFTYDTQAMQLSLEKARLEVEQMQGNIKSLEAQKASLEKSRAAASAADQLNFTLEIKDVEAQLLEAQYNLSLKQKELEKLQAATDEGQVTSPVEGVVQTINAGGSSGNSGEGSDSQAFMTLMETGEYRVKGTVNEYNRSLLEEGAKILVRSRTSDETWSGTVTKIDWDNPIKRQNNNYSDSGSDTMSTSSNYPFYVDLDETDGLMLGEHVYLEIDNGQTAQQEGIYLPAYYLNEIDKEQGTAWVWAANKRGKLEKRTVQIAEYAEDQDCWLVTDGLAEDDLLAVPDDTLREGMRTQEYDPNAEQKPADTDSETDGVTGGSEDGTDTANGVGQMEADTGDVEPVTGDGETDISTGEADPGDMPADEAEGAVG